MIEMIKQALKKHGTMKKHADNEKKIVFFKYKIVLKSYSY
jgi:hypothetical protein